jgi:MFS family permease
MANEQIYTSDSGMSLGPIRMVPGVDPRHIFSLFFASFFGIAVMSYMNAGQPIIFQEILGLDSDSWGGVAGTLTFYHEIVVLICIAPIGALSDKIGRRPVYMAAFILLGFGHFLYPLADDLAQLTMYRIIFAVGTAAASAMLAAVANDYPQEKSRAKMIAATMFFNAIGMVVVTSLLKNGPDYYQNMGYSVIESIQFTRWSVTAICFMVAVVAITGLKKGVVVTAQKSIEKPGVMSTLQVGFAAGKTPRVALSYFAALVSRGDLAVLSTFFTIWLFKEGVDQGMTTTAAMSAGLKFYVLIQAAALPAAVVAGFYLDKIDRVFGLMIAMIFAASGYMSLAFVANPLGTEMYYCAVLIGIGEITANLSALSLVGKEAPASGRGAVIGMFSFFGALGILLVAKIGGYLFDNWETVFGLDVTSVGPFILVGIANGVVFVLCGVLLLSERVKAAR